HARRVRPRMFALASTPSAVPIKMDPVSLVLHSSGAVFLVVWSLVLAAAIVWIITVLKLLQLARMGGAQRRFEADASQAYQAEHLFQIARQHPGAPGARGILELSKRGGGAKLLDAIAKRAIVSEQQRAGSLMATLSSIASAG